ncbi:uncharacterized protein BJ212DRAFT_1490077 [Suillus subaureus]|uniref:Uncharacterized protein n=1 Tax=Suillus subaureus TaxID=48587 RepID=A0A9P7DIP4_9AGAM|nr:uncharacterized protein BJ212DRAFT_1490077 [Suillus subaureus]KAG1794493.1 hypothetical protein BJ212DRAFT_1490077 [Suillus subaureus]
MDGTSRSLKKEFITNQDPNYQPAPYFQACCPVLEEWCKAIANVIAKDKDVSHGEIHEIIKQGIENLSSHPLPAPSLIPAPKVPSSIIPQLASSSVAPPLFFPPTPLLITQEFSF